MKLRSTISRAAAAAATLAGAACAEAEEAVTTEATAQTATAVAGYQGEAAKGRALFVTKGCVICHSVNGVGGRAAPTRAQQAGGPTARGTPCTGARR